MKHRVTHTYPVVLSITGILLFTAMYFIAARLYPGGSNADPGHVGFDWINNYWCDMIVPYGKNSMPNEGMPVAMTAMIVLFASMAVFWFHLPGFFRETKRNRLLTGYVGIVSMLSLIFIFTKYHDTVIMIGGSLSSIPFVESLVELYRYRKHTLFILGSLCLVFIALNFFIYLSGWQIAVLPLIQKITLVFFLVWVLLVDVMCLLLPKQIKGSATFPEL